MVSSSDLLLGDAEQRSRMLGKRGENLFVNRARFGAASCSFVPRSQRKGILDAELH